MLETDNDVYHIRAWLLSILREYVKGAASVTARAVSMGEMFTEGGMDIHTVSAPPKSSLAVNPSSG